MTNPLISVIIPVYNVEKYLDRCIESVVNQTYRNLEIILVDDGSPDRCPQICDDWSTKDPRIRVIHKANGGLSSARNTGLQNSNGEYLYFIDSDDWIELDMLQSLYDACSHNDVLLSVCGRYVHFENNNSIQIDKCPAANEIMPSKVFVSHMLIGDHCDSCAWDKLFHKSLLVDIRFPEGRIYEDVAIMYKIALSTSCVATLSKQLYHYFRHSGSILMSGFSERLFDYPINTRNLLSDISHNYSDLYEYACWTHINALIRVLDKLSRADRKTYHKYKRMFRQLQDELSSLAGTWKHSAVFSERDRKRIRHFTNGCFPRIVGSLKQITKAILRANR